MAAPFFSAGLLLQDRVTPDHWLCPTSAVNNTRVWASGNSTPDPSGREGEK